EPGPNPIIRSQLPRTIAADHIVDGSSISALRKLDVIVAGHNWHMRPDVLNAVDAAVHDGVGILEQAGFAKLTPSFTEQVCALSGLDRADLFSNARGGMCRIVAAHPILGDLKVGDEISAPMLFGAIGPIRGTPLIAATM